MTYVVDTGVATLCHSQNHSGSVPIPTRGMPARPASEDSFSESEGLLGSRETPRTRHRRIRRLPRHLRLREKLGLEVLHRQQLMLTDDTLGPDQSVVPVLPGRLLLHLRAHRHGVLGPIRLLHAAHPMEGGRRFLSLVNEGVSAPDNR